MAFATGAIAAQTAQPKYELGKTYVYKYAKDMGLPQEVWKELKPLGKMDENERILVDTLSILEPQYQIVVVSDSDFLKNKHLSPKELETLIEWSKNPSLNPVPNPREGYVVLANGYDDEYGIKVSCMVAWYKQFRDNGYPHENIFLRLYHPNNEEIIKTQYYKDLERFIRPISELFPETADEVKIDSKDGSLSGFLKTIKNLPSDPNDWVYIMYTGEAGAIGGAEFIGYPHPLMDHVMLNKAIASIDYERAYVIQSTCYAAALLKDLDKPKNIGNTFAIASVGEKATSVRDWFVKLAIVYVGNPNMSIKELIDGVNVEPPYDPDKAEYFYFDVEKKECPWINEPFILPMNK